MRVIGRGLKRKLMIGVAIVAVLAGGTAAVVMASQSSAHHHRAGTLATASKRVEAEVDRAGGASTRSVSVRAASSYLGIAAAQLRAEQRSGRSLAQIAEATSGKSTAGLVDALVAAKRHTIDAALKAGVIKQAQADKLLSRLVARMTARVHRG
jgi:hypothetical protein